MINVENAKKYILFLFTKMNTKGYNENVFLKKEREE